MNVVAFAVTDAVGPTIDADFYGFEPDLIAHGDVATVVIRSGEPPAVTDETMLAYHHFVEQVAAVRGCLPHRFGLVVDESAVVQELEQNGDTYVRALDGTRGRYEWLLRSRAIPEPAAVEAMHATGQRPPPGSALETGEMVHHLVAAHLADRSSDLSDALTSSGDDVFVRGHKDGLGFDLEIVAAQPVDEFPGLVDERCDSLTHFLDFELFGPTPCYRYSDRMMRSLI